MPSRRERKTETPAHWCTECKRPIDHLCPHTRVSSRAQRRAAERAARKARNP